MVIAQWRAGWARVMAAPMLVIGVFAITFLLAVPLAVVMRGELRSHLGSSLAAEEAAAAVNYDWWQEFTAQATGLGTTFTPSVIGFATALDSISSVLDARARTSPIVSVVAFYLAGWAFLSGGILDRYARQRPTGTHGFFAASAVHFFRFLRLGVIAGLIYWWLFAYVHPWLFGEQFVNLTRGMDVERTAFLVRALFYAVFGALLVATNVVVDYAKIRIVVEDRRSALGALGAALRFVRGNFAKVASLYALNSITFVMVLAAWGAAAPRAGGAGATIWLGFLAAQIYVTARLMLKLQFMASQTALFQAQLAHATYTAAPVAMWPESPAAETIASRSPLSR